MKLKILKEHYVNIMPEDVDTKEKYLDDVWTMIEDAYRSIGGAFKQKEEITDRRYFWKLVRRNGKLTAAGIYKMNDRDGRKLVLCASDGTESGKKDLYSILRDNMQVDRANNQNAWAEVSEAMEHIIVKKWGVTPIPNDIAEVVMNNIGKKIKSKNSDGYHYTREIDGKDVEKVLVGYPPKDLTIRANNDIELLKK